MSGKESKTCIRPHAISFEGVQKVTRDSFRDECDVNKIIERFHSTGQLPPGRAEKAQYGDAPTQTLFEAACIRAEIASKGAEGAFDDHEGESVGSDEKEPENGSEEAVQRPDEEEDQTTEEGV